MKKYLITGLLALTTMGALAADKKDEKKADNKYPLDTCVVSGEKLDSMGKPYVIKYKGRDVQLCCDGCEKDFNKDPDKYLKKLDAAEKKAAKKADKEKAK